MAMVRCFSPRRIFPAYFLGFLVLFLYVLLNIESFCPELKDDVYVDKELKRLKEQREELNSQEKWLKTLQRRLRMKYPTDFEEFFLERSDEFPTIFAITPTYSRPVQKAELVRIMNTFTQVPNFHWIVIEDSPIKSELVTNLLARSGMRYTHLNVGTPTNMKLRPNDPNWLKPRGVLQRNAGLSWIRQNVDPAKTKGTVYFADDDNTYSLELFDEMRYTDKVSVWPVGLVGYLRYESPIVKHGKVTGWFTYWLPERPFAMDMAGFSLNLQLLFDYRDARFSFDVRRGELESALLGGFHLTLSDLEPKADNCTKVLVWHTRTEKASLKNENNFIAKGLTGSDLSIEV